MSAEAVELLDVNFDDLGGFLDSLLELAPAFDDEEAAHVRSQLEELMRRVRGAIGTVDQRLLQLIGPGETLQIPGIGAITVEARGKQTTHGAKLARTVALRVADSPIDPETGEVLPPSVLAFKIADDITAVFGLDTPSTSFRKSEVENRNLRPSEFRDFTDGASKVVFTR